MTMPGRSYSSGSKYRYGFNGKEKSAEITSDDYDFGARVYDSRVGRFLSIDRFTGRTPFYSPYLYAGNKPTIAIDYNGDVEIIVTYYKTDRFGKLRVETHIHIIETIEDIRGITRDAYKINVYEKEVLMSRPWMNGTTTWYGYETTSIEKEQKSGQSPEERYYSGLFGVSNKFLGKFIAKVWPIAKAVDAFEERDPYTGEYRHPSRKYWQTAEAILDVVSLGRGVVAKQAAKPVLDYFKNKLIDHVIETIIEAAMKNSFLKDQNKIAILLYHTIKLYQDGKKGKLDELTKVLDKIASFNNKASDVVIKQQLISVGVDFDAPESGKKALDKALKDEGLDASKVKVTPATP
jgi:RHS repeat-associated protein